jgi:tetratricopeptide (TPR) repeat protein
MAQLADTTKSPSAVLWRSRVVELDPKSTEDRLALVRTAMTARDLNVATNALAQITDSGKTSAAYQNLAGMLAVATGQFEEAKAYFSEAARLEANNPTPQLNLAVIQLKGTNQAEISQAREVLASLTQNNTNKNVRLQALRELTMDALRTRSGDAALTHSAQLLADTNSVFGDHLLRLQVLDSFDRSAVPEKLRLVEREAQEKENKIVELANWKLPKVGPEKTLEWLETLPADYGTNKSVNLLRAECRTALQRWQELSDTLASQNWDELEFLRYAFRSRALRGLNLHAASKAEWELALKASFYHRQALSMLLRVAGQWNWINEGEEVLWAIVNRFPTEKWAVMTLARTLQMDGQTRPLHELCKLESSRSPKVLPWKNNMIMLSLLLNATESNPYQEAENLYKVAGTNATFASTYAFSLWHQGKHQQALEVMQKLSQRDLETESIAGYYGLVLTSNGDTNRARSYFGWALKSQLLPEERKLFTDAMSKL